MTKVKHARTADCVVAGFRWHKSGKDAVGSLLLGLYDDKGVLHHVGVTSSFTMATRKAAREGARAAAQGRVRSPPMARMGAGRGERNAAHARRAEPLERGQGPFLGAAAHRARVRGEVRPPAGRPVPARGDLPALAPGQAARDCRYDQLEVHQRLRARKGLRGGFLIGVQGFLRRAQFSGTCCRLMRMRVQGEAPAHGVYSTSAGSRCAAASGWRFFQRSRPASASSWRWARPISMSGCLGASFEGCTRAGSPACFL